MRRISVRDDKLSRAVICSRRMRGLIAALALAGCGGAVASPGPEGTWQSQDGLMGLYFRSGAYVAQLRGSPPETGSYSVVGETLSLQPDAGPCPPMTTEPLPWALGSESLRLTWPQDGERLYRPASELPVLAGAGSCWTGPLPK